ncbi:MAG TPA: hypothetical protein VNU45_18005 [Rummeliibacillus sp.]|nr:hypothetical protein [Rummeliibacillus sp.]
MSSHTDVFLMQMQKELDELALVIKGASLMIDTESPHHNFLMYVRKVIFSMYDEISLHRIALENKDKPIPNCS